MAQSATHSQNGANSGALLSEEYEHVPLKQRLKMMLATNSISFDSGVKLEGDIPELTSNTIGAVARKRENKHSNSQMIETITRQEKLAVKVEGGVDSLASKCRYSYSSSGIQKVNFDPEMSDQFHGELDHVVLKERLRWLLASKSLELQSKLEENYSGISVSVSESGHKQSAGREGQLSSCYQKLAVPGNSSGIQRKDDIKFSEKAGSIYEPDGGRALLSTKQKLANIKVEPPNCHEFESFNVMTEAKMSLSHFVSKNEEVDNLDDLYEAELDHMLLRGRMKLLSSKNVPRMNIHQTSECLSTTVPSALNSNTGISKPVQSLKVNLPRKRRKTVTDSIEMAMEEDAPGLLQENYPGISVSVSESGHKQSAGRVGQLSSCDQKLAVPGISSGIQRKDGIKFSEKVGSIYEPDCGRALLSGSITPVQDSTKQKLANIKVEPPTCHEFESFNVMTETKMSFSHLVSKNEEVDNLDGLYEAELDHMLLRDRMKLLSSKNVPRMNIHQNSECLSTTVPSALNSNTGLSKPIQSLKVNRPRKRRKTVTDSIEIAMEEDAPGLLQVLIEKGVSLDEIKLYGESESKDALHDSSTEDNFSELEAVISKLFTQRESLLRLGPLRCGKGENASYCLACLFSLVEQARYLQFRNWPVEWGWCRDLQSFIFVFERHNRIVLERPEYGYATYFFELAASLPIRWQIKRLVTAMKLTSCGRVTLLENKALMVGEELTEGEARVLTEFGWIPNTGLGTMLNYFDRVVHDRKNEKYTSSEWRSKIGKLLMDGYNGGTTISVEIPNVTEYNSMQIKLELD